jgi:RNA polymerase sigma factor (sigma-70 family)
MFCAKCGAELLEEARFCSRCGSAFAKPEAAGTDAELERLAAQGDREAFAELYGRHSGRVYDFLLRMVGDPDEASDLMQETFLRAMRALSPEEKGAAFSTWVLTIARNLALKRLERRKRTVTLAPREGDEEAPIFDQVDPDRLTDPQAAAEAQELAGLVWEAASGLDAKQYSLLDLHVRQGLESAEIAEVLGVSKGNAYTMVSRLRDTFESAVGSLFMLRVGRRDCPELNRLLQEQSVTALSPAVRRLIEGHVAECEACQERRRKLVSPANILGSFAAVPLPLLLKQRVAEALVASWAQAGTQAAATGLKGLLSQPAAKLSSLSTAWKAVIISGALVVATGGGLSTWVAVTGGLPGSGGGPSGSGVQAVETPGAPSTAAPVQPTQQPSAGTGRIVFLSNRDATDPYTGSIYLMDADGGNVARIGRGGSLSSVGLPPDLLRSGLSPDGTRLAFQKCPNPTHEDNWAALYVESTDGSEQTPLATETVRCQTEGPDGGFGWSPDSRHIVLYRGGERPGLYVVDADGSNLKYLTEGIFPQWSPLGDSIAFTDKPDPEGWQCGIYLINPDGTNRRLLAHVFCDTDFGLVMGPQPQWSPDGSMLAFSASLEEPPSPPSEPRNPEREVFVMNADGSALTNITNSPSDDHDPIWVDCRVPTAGCEAAVANVQSGYLDVRRRGFTESSNPWDNLTAIAKLSQGDSVCVLGAPVVGDGYKWWPISTTDGTEGWVAAFDPQDPARPWITPTGEPCSGEAEPQEPARAGGGAGEATCGGRMRLGASIDDPEGDVPFAFVDIVGARVEAMGEEVLAEIGLKDIPEQLTFNQARQPTLEYAWQIFFDIDGDPNTGNVYRPMMIGAEYSLSILHFAEGDSQQVKTGALLDNTQADVWKRDLTGEGWSTDWRTDTATSTATAAVDDLGNVLTIQGTIPGLGPSTRWCVEAYYQDPDGRHTVDAAPD